MEGGYVGDKRELYHVHSLAQRLMTRADLTARSQCFWLTAGPGFERNTPMRLTSLRPFGMSIRHAVQLRTLLALAAVAVALAAAAACGSTGNMASSGSENAPEAGEDDTLLASILREEEPTGLSSFRQLLDRDDIDPVYDPSFVSVSQSGLQPDELVIGVSIDGDSRAYPIRYLRWREMVNDEVGGVPILVTW